MIDGNLRNHKLCFIKDDFAYFTDQPIEEVKGEDWSDRPYYCNAGVPKYTFRVWFWSTLQQPHQYPYEYSAEQINQKAIPWLYSPVTSTQTIKLWAGTKFWEFCDAVEQSDGEIFVPLKWLEEK